jgi:hypothetical protein
MSLISEALLDHILADFLKFISSAQSFWVSLNTSYAPPLNAPPPPPLNAVFIFRRRHRRHRHHRRRRRCRTHRRPLPKKERHQHHHHQRTNGSTIMNMFTSPDNLDLFNLSTVFEV